MEEKETLPSVFLLPAGCCQPPYLWSRPGDDRSLQRSRSSKGDATAIPDFARSRGFSRVLRVLRNKNTRLKARLLVGKVDIGSCWRRKKCLDRLLNLLYTGLSSFTSDYYERDGMNTLEQLMLIGFTEYEARVYLALLGNYPTTGYQISKDAGVPRSMVYEALGRLKVRGAVLETPDERATLYRPLPPDVLLDNHQAAQQRLVGDLRGGMAMLYQRRDDNLVWSIRGRDTVLSYARELICQAQREVYLVLDDPDVDVLRDTVCAASERQVGVSAVLTGEAVLGCGEIVRHPPLESQLHELSGTLVLVVDSQETLVAAKNEGDMTATVTRNRNLVLIARQFVWMELFAQRIFSRLGNDLLARLDPDDRMIFEGAG